jgi:hypothetical protein
VIKVRQRVVLQPAVDLRLNAKGMAGSGSNAKRISGAGFGIGAEVRNMKVLAAGGILSKYGGPAGGGHVAFFVDQLPG